MNENVTKNVTELNPLELNALITDLHTTIVNLTEQKNAAYAERNKCIVIMARMALALGLEAGLGRHEEEDKDWEDDWRNIVFIDLPTGQVSWHIHDSELPLFEWLLQYKCGWDGHTTEEKYQRVLEARF
jgi:hypothetical protein